jgi:hypothetical protein
MVQSSLKFLNEDPADDPVSCGQFKTLKNSTQPEDDHSTFDFLHGIEDQQSYMSAMAQN